MQTASQGGLSDSGDGQSLHERLALAASELETLDPAGRIYASRILRLGERLSEGRFHLAVLGQFKRGKSTFVNALLGARLLPTSILPLTALPTFVRWGQRPSARVQLADGTVVPHDPASSDFTLEEFLLEHVS